MIHVINGAPQLWGGPFWSIVEDVEGGGALEVDATAQGRHPIGNNITRGWLGAYLVIHEAKYVSKLWAKHGFVCAHGL